MELVMAEMPPPYNAAPPAPAPRRFPTWAIIVIVVLLLCLCAMCLIVVIISTPAIRGGAAGGQLVFICMEKNPDLGAEGCGEWSQEVVKEEEFTDCATELSVDGTVSGETLYACLEEAGVGP
jgi:hypothetical protein